MQFDLTSANDTTVFLTIQAQNFRKREYKKKYGLNKQKPKLQANVDLNFFITKFLYVLPCSSNYF